ncbi:MAG TPA: protein kinase [Polyangia bacterium]|jgi:Tol biopolymer transport system component|nr:protein kinase [Polyangia bacterium]
MTIHMPPPRNPLTLPVAPQSPRLAEHGLEPGACLGSRYELRMLLGEGGMGAVFLARDMALASDVALKLLYRDVASQEEALRRVRTEVLLAHKITHPNVCRTYDLEHIDDLYFVKMEYVAGETLAKRHQSHTQLPVAEVLRIARAVASGLVAAHAQDVVHCDLKPENILIEHGTERVVLMDFGLARIQSRSRLGDQKDVSGTPAYMAPEQLASSQADARSDLYALGCVMYELLTGDVPHPLATTFENALQYSTEPIVPVHEKRADVPPWLSRVIARLLDKDPQKRYRSANELLIALDWPRRLLRRGIIGGLAVLLGLVMSLTWYAGASRPASWQPQIKARSPAYDENASNAAISPDGQSLAYVADRDETWRVYVEPLSGGPARTIASLGYVGSLRWTHDSRALLGVTPDDRLVRISVQDGGIEQLAEYTSAADDCNGRLVFVTQDVGPHSGEARFLMREPSGYERDLLRIPGDSLIKELHCDRAGRQLAYASIITKPGIVDQSDIYILDLEEGKPRRLTFDQQNNRNPTFASDGKSVIFSSLQNGTSELMEIPIQGGKSLLIPTGLGRVVLTTGLARTSGADVSPDGHLLVYSEEAPAFPLFAYDLATQRRRRVHSALDLLWQVHPAPDGRELILRMTRQGKNYAAAIDIADGKERLLTPADAVTLTIDGREVIYAINDDKGAEIRAIPRTGGPSRLISRVSGAVASLHLDAAGWIYPWIKGMSHEGTWKVPLAGGDAIRESTLADAIVLPAPVGGWRLVGHKLNSSMLRWHLLRPGEPLDTIAAKTFDARPRIAWASDGTFFLSWNGREIIRHTLPPRGGEEVLMSSDVIDEMALSHDGKTLFLGEWSGHVTRQMIINFDERPRPWK